MHRFWSPARRVPRAVTLGVLVIVLSPVFAVHAAYCRLRSRSARGRTVEVPRVAATEIDLDAVIRRPEPVVITGLDESLGLHVVPDVDGLRTLAAEHPGCFRVAAYKRHSPYFLYVGDYGAEFDHATDMTLDEFLDEMFTVGTDPDLVRYKLFAVDDVDGAIGGVIDDISDRLTERVTRTPDRAASGIWVGSEGAVTPLHHDAWTGILFQFAGTKRVAMYSPADRTNLYFTSPFAARDRWSRLPGRSGDADTADFPLLARTSRYETVLGPGDALYIPPFWSHEMEALEANISIPYRFTTTTLNHLNPGFLRPAFEILHRNLVPTAA